MVSRTPKKSKSTPAGKHIPAMVECGKSYSLKEFRRITGFTFEAVRQMRADGLRVIQVRNEHWIRGDDYHAFLGQQPTVDEAKNHSGTSESVNQSESTLAGGIDGST